MLYINACVTVSVLKSCTICNKVEENISSVLKFAFRQTNGSEPMWIDVQSKDNHHPMSFMI